MDITVARAALIGSIEHGEMFVAEMRRPLDLAVGNHAVVVKAHDVFENVLDFLVRVPELFQALSDDRVGKHHVTAAGEFFVDDMREERLDTGRRAVHSERDRTCRRHDGNLSIAVTV